jgi:hypothetical protein
MRCAPGVAVLFLVAFSASAQDIAPADTQQASTTPSLNGTVRYTGNYVLTRDVGPRSTTSRGEITVELTFTGSSVSGFYLSPAPMGSESISGTRVGDTCNLRDSNTSWQMHCGADRLDGNGASAEGVNPPITLQIDAAAMRVARVAQRPAPPVSTQTDRNATAPLSMAGDAWTRKLEGIVETDSKGWLSNQFDTGSVHDVRIVDGSIETGNFLMKGSYTYNGGAGGWVEAKIVNGALSCLIWWDGGPRCKGLRTAAGAERARNNLKELTGAIAASAKEASESGTPVPESKSENASIKQCADLSFQSVSEKDYDSGLPSYHWHSRNGMSNNCAYPVAFHVTSVFGDRWERVSSGQWRQFDDTDQWTGEVRRVK